MSNFVKILSKGLELPKVDKRTNGHAKANKRVFG